MLNLAYTALLLVSIVEGGSHVSGTYNHVANCETTFYTQDITLLGEDDKAYTFVNLLNLTFKCWYNDEGNYRLDTFHFELDSNCYQLTPSNTYQLYDYCYVSYVPDWSFTQNSYASEFELTTFKVFIDDDRSFGTIAYFDGHTAEESYAQNGPLFSTTAQLVLSFDSSQLFNQIENYVGLNSGEGSYDGGFTDGYTQGYYDASQQNQTAVTIFSGILNVGLLPINFFLKILNFEVFGINIGDFVSGLLTIALIAILVRFIFQHRGDL